MKHVIIPKGAPIVLELTSPDIEPGEASVRVQAACLSVGNKMIGVRATALSTCRRALSTIRRKRVICRRMAPTLAATIANKPNWP